MKITIDKNVVEFTPENSQETADMEVLWRVVVDCVQDSKRMSPIGEFIPGKSDTAKFFIEGIPGGQTTYTDDSVSDDCTVICMICNKYANLKPGDSIPVCCGKPMETVD